MAYNSYRIAIFRMVQAISDDAVLARIYRYV